MMNLEVLVSTFLYCIIHLFFQLGLEKEQDISNCEVTDWHGNPWNPGQGTKAAHPNARFCAPASNCPVMDPHWEDPKGVIIEAILFGGHRPEGVPLIYETFDWQNGVFAASSMCSEATFAAEHKGNQIMRDPFAMRPFFGYNAGKYVQHWLDMEKPGRKMPKIYHVNWFRIDHDQPEKGFLWPGMFISNSLLSVLSIIDRLKILIYIGQFVRFCVNQIYSNSRWYVSGRI